MFTTEKNERSRSHVSLHRTPLTNEGRSSLFVCPGSQLGTRSSAARPRDGGDREPLREEGEVRSLTSVLSSDRDPIGALVRYHLWVGGCYGCEFMRGWQRGKWRARLLLGHVTGAALICFDKQRGGKSAGRQTVSSTAARSTRCGVSSAFRPWSAPDPSVLCVAPLACQRLENFLVASARGARRSRGSEALTLECLFEKVLMKTTKEVSTGDVSRAE